MTINVLIKPFYGATQLTSYFQLYSVFECLSSSSIELVYSDYRNMKNQFNSIIYLNGRRCQNSVVGMAIYNHLALDIPSLSKHEKFVSSTPFLV